MNKKVAQNLINKTKEDYNKISEHFNSTRGYNWLDFADALKKLNLKKGDKVLDLGCGNGRILTLLKPKGIKYFGIDISEDLISIAKEEYPEGNFMVGDITNTPYKDNEFDAVISVATLHHIPSKELRIKAIKEIERILKPGKETIITNWYFWNKPKYLKMIWNEGLNKLLGKSKLDFGDFMMPWKDSKRNVIVERYFHAWRSFEIKRLLKRNNFEVLDTKINRNLIVIAKKL